MNIKIKKKQLHLAMPSFDNQKNQPSVALSTQMKDISLTNGDNESDMDSGIF